jgi:hypothetical protein
MADLFFGTCQTVIALQCEELKIVRVVQPEQHTRH